MPDKSNYKYKNKLVDKAENNLSTVSPQQVVDKEANEIITSLVKENDSERIKNITKLFQINQSKKNIMRIMRYGGLLDKVGDQIAERFEKNPNAMSNEDIIKYLKVLQDSISISQEYIDNIEEKPMISITNNKNELNINVAQDETKLDRDSRENVMNAINEILKIAAKNNSEEAIDVEENKEEDVENKGVE